VSILGQMRDIVIIILAIESLFIGVLLALVAIQLRGLIKLLRDEVKPILDSANETVGTVRGTTDFVSEVFVSPLIKAASLFQGLRKVIEVLARRRKR